MELSPREVLERDLRRYLSFSLGYSATPRVWEELGDGYKYRGSWDVWTGINLVFILNVISFNRIGDLSLHFICFIDCSRQGDP